MMRLFSNDDLNIALELGVRTRLAALLVQGESAEKIFFDLVAVHGEIETIQCVSVDRRVLVLAHPPKHEFYGLPSRTLAEGLVFISDADRRAAGTDLLRGPKWVLLPPSINPDGSRWEWIQGSGPGEVKIATCPTWLLNAARNGLRTECDQ
jgi:hypothetical protein